MTSWCISTITHRHRESQRESGAESCPGLAAAGVGQGGWGLRCPRLPVPSTMNMGHHEAATAPVPPLTYPPPTNMSYERKPLYRKVNTRARGVHHGFGGDFRHERNTKRFKEADATRGSMHASGNRGLDYTPLFRFLLSSVGRNWDDVY